MWSTRRKDPMALYEHANELAMRGDIKRAAAYYQKAIDSGHQRAAAEAGIKLGLLHKRAFRLTMAEEAYRAAIATGHPDLAPSAAYLLAGLLSSAHRHEAAADAYRQVMAFDHDLAADALYGLAELTHYDLDDAEQAAVLYRQAIDTGHPDAAPKALFGLAQLLVDDDPDTAADLYRRAMDTGHLRAAPYARRQLRELQERRGEPVDPPLPPSLRPTVGDSGCQLLLDGDGAVEGLWFENADEGHRYATDSELVRQVVLENKLADLLDLGYEGGADGTRGGYLIRFRRTV